MVLSVTVRLSYERERLTRLFKSKVKDSAEGSPAAFIFEKRGRLTNSSLVCSLIVALGGDAVPFCRFATVVVCGADNSLESRKGLVEIGLADGLSRAGLVGPEATRFLKGLFEPRGGEVRRSILGREYQQDKLQFQQGHHQLRNYAARCLTSIST